MNGKVMIRLTDGHNVMLIYEDKNSILEHIYLITGKWQSQQPVCEPRPPRSACIHDICFYNSHPYQLISYIPYA